MSDQRDGGISWTDQTWNPVRGCSRLSPGCQHCYAETMAARFAGPGMPYEGLARRTESGEARWTGEVRLVPEHLADPLRWRRPRKIFVNSMSDLFHERLSNEDIAAVFGVMAAAPQHTFQVLTKRAERMREWFEWITPNEQSVLHCQMLDGLDRSGSGEWRWPLPNVLTGVSVEDQQRADERIPHLLACPAAVRFVSAEPLLGPIDIEDFIPDPIGSGPHTFDPMIPCRCGEPSLDWVIIGGESGPGARPMDLEWARSLVRQCRDAGVACWVKQLGSRPFEVSTCGFGYEMPKEPGDRPGLLFQRMHDRKGALLADIPADLRVRQWPGEAT